MNKQETKTLFSHKYTISSSDRALLKNQRPCCIWLTGLSGSGKSTIANSLDQMMYKENYHTYVLDGDNIRHSLNKDLGFSNTDRIENIRRISEVARLMVDAGIFVIVSAISPFRSDRLAARNRFEHKQFIEVFVDAPLHECIRRDPKKLYNKALAGNISDFTGLDSPYDIPEFPEVVVDTVKNSAVQCAIKILNYLKEIKSK